MVEICRNLSALVRVPTTTPRPYGVGACAGRWPNPDQSSHLPDKECATPVTPLPLSANSSGTQLASITAESLSRLRLSHPAWRLHTPSRPSRSISILVPALKGLEIPGPHLNPILHRPHPKSFGSPEPYLTASRQSLPLYAQHTPGTHPAHAQHTSSTRPAHAPSTCSALRTGASLPNTFLAPAFTLGTTSAPTIRSSCPPLVVFEQLNAPSLARLQSFRTATPRSMAYESTWNSTSGARLGCLPGNAVNITTHAHSKLRGSEAPQDS
ncbi:hypothetical protein B0H67DRAFT_110110 [Lasiosphaeris hirsuta]|uniref:Uncharacterized protein n=1 Tax=Lasiosphaeris hirsuta TaxID=260670 RepID=A0AA40AZ21_9PEZI|nr:hypothetical protein B0H67DRAFT_110110 [Lasiosphaeris hirsuta]